MNAAMLSAMYSFVAGLHVRLLAKCDKQHFLHSLSSVLTAPNGTLQPMHFTYQCYLVIMLTAASFRTAAVVSNFSTEALSPPVCKIR